MSVFAATTFDVGDNIVQIAIAAFGLATLMWNTRKTTAAVNAAQRGAESAEKASKQLERNGGSSALDQILATQETIIVELRTHGDRLDQLEQVVPRRRTDQYPPPAPPPPPVVPQWLAQRGEPTHLHIHNPPIAGD